MGVLKSVEECTDFTSKAGKMMTKREVHICDDSGKGVDVTIWGETGRLLDLKVGGVLGVKAAKISSSDFKTLSLSVSWDSKLESDPADNPTASRLRAWLMNDPNCLGSTVTLSERGSGGGGGGGASGEAGPLGDIFKRMNMSIFSEASMNDGLIAQDAVYVVKGSFTFPNKVCSVRLPPPATLNGLCAKCF